MAKCIIKFFRPNLTKKLSRYSNKVRQNGNLRAKPPYKIKKINKIKKNSEKNFNAQLLNFNKIRTFQILEIFIPKFSD